ncbi:hypothetical protein CALVIDRAFT_459564, partial [Calocera viscosa TUFC12733]
NPEQQRAVRRVFDHATTCESKQLLLYIGGPGGTGKSHVINCIVSMFAALDMSDSLLLSTPTGAAAIVINGYTIHALTLLPQRKKGRVNMPLLDSIWNGVTYLVLDEISMVSALFLSEIACQMSL